MTILLGQIGPMLNTGLLKLKKEEAVRSLTVTDYHPCGTCRMSHGTDGVVDSELRVHGMEALRVVDASVMPRVLSGNLNAPTMMIASRAADWILGTPQLEPFEARFAFQGADPA